MKELFVGAPHEWLGLNSVMRSQRWRRVMPTLHFSMDTSSWSVRACAGPCRGTHRLSGTLLLAADPFTKYLTYSVWSRHMHFLLNKPGPVPPYPGKA